MKIAIGSIARICHQANKAWCEVNGDKTQVDWDETPEWQRSSAVNGVIYRIQNPESGCDAMHNNWMAEKIADGWVYGNVKDSEKKTHPCIIRFEDLPEFQQKKDKLFSAIVDALK